MNETGHHADTTDDAGGNATSDVASDATNDSAAHEREVDAAIARLRNEIERLHDDDPESRRELGLLADRLAARLEEKRRIEEDEPVDNAVLDMVNTYESRYPQVTLMINDIVTRLASMGI